MIVAAPIPWPLFYTLVVILLAIAAVAFARALWLIAVAACEAWERWRYGL